MKLSNHILRKPFYVAFGTAQQGSGITSVDLVTTRNATAVTMTASDGSAAQRRLPGPMPTPPGS